MISAEAFLEQHAPILNVEENGVACSNIEQSNAGNIGAQETHAKNTSSTKANRTKKKRMGNGFGYTITDNPESEEACKEAALNLLDASSRSSGTLRDKLAQRGFMPDVVDVVIARLEELHLIDDEAYGRAVVRACIHKHMGARGTVMELVRKGVEQPLAQRIVQDIAQTGAFEEAAWELGRIVAKKTQGLDLQVRKRRLWSAGSRKGHDSQILAEVAQSVFADDATDNFLE